MARKRSSQKDKRNSELNNNFPKNGHIPFFENGYCRGKENRHGFMLYNPNDFIGQTLDAYGEWAFSEIDLINQLLKPGFIVLDVGANIGTHTLQFAKSVQPNGLVYAFEPQRIAFEFLCANIVLNNYLNIFPMMAGVSDNCGEITVPIVNPNTRANSGSINIESYSNGDMVRLLTIDSLNLNSCNFIKVDVEGMERKVLLGAKETIKKFRPFLFVENNTPEKSEDLIKLLLDQNYNCWWVFTAYLNREDIYGNEFKPGEGFKPDFNMVCIPSEFNINVTGFQKVLGADDTGEKAILRLQNQIKPS
jgi:FkbM family methyltransferase